MYGLLKDWVKATGFDKADPTVPAIPARPPSEVSHLSPKLLPVGAIKEDQSLLIASALVGVLYIFSSAIDNML